MTDAERAAKLKAAAELVIEVMRDLDSSETECAECSAPHYSHYGEYKAFIELDGVAGKIQKWAASITRGLPKTKKDRRG